MIEMVVESVRVHTLSTQHVVILKELDRDRYLPIWIGPWEANAIALRLQGVSPERPLTHDLFARTLVELGVELQRIVVSDLADETFRARLVLDQRGEVKEIDARPSDAIALALRTRSPILVEESVIENARTADFTTEPADNERLQKWLESLDPEELGKYKM